MLRLFFCLAGLFILVAPAAGQYTGSSSYVTIRDQYRAEEFEKVLESKPVALAIAAQRNDSIAANIYSFIGYSHYYVGEVDSALTFFERELVIRKALKVVAYTDYSNTMYNLMSVYNQAGLYNEAIATGEELLKEDRAHYGVESREYGESAWEYLRTLGDQGNFKKEKEEAERILEEIGRKHVSYAMILNRYADALAALGEYSKAEKVFRESLAEYRAMDEREPLSETSTLVNLANMYLDEGQIIEAEEIYQNALKTFKEYNTPDADEMYYASLNNLGIALLKLSRAEEASQLYDNLLEHDKSTYGDDHPFYINSLNNAGMAFSDAGNFTKAEYLFNIARDLEKKSGGDTSSKYASIINNLGKVYYLSGQPKKAIPLLEQAAAIFASEFGEESLEYSISIFNQGVAWMMLKSPKAKDLLTQALTIREKKFGKAHPKYGETTNKLAVYEWMANNTKQASVHFQSTFTNYYQQIERYFPGLSEAEKTKFYYQGLRPAFEVFNSFAVQNQKQMPELLGRLYDIQLNTKGLILYSTNKVRSNLLKSGDAVTLKQYEEWLTLKETISKLYSAGDESKASLLDSLEQVANVTEKELTKKSSAFDKNAKRTWNTWKEVQSKLGPQDVAVEIIRYRDYTPDSGGYYTGEVKYGALLVRKKSKSPELVMIPNVDNKLEKQNLHFYRNAIKFEMADPHSYNLYWKPLADRLGSVKKIYFSPDGVYNQINLNSLKNPATGKFVLDDFAIEYVTNTKDVFLRTVSAKSSGKTYLFGFPQYAIATQQQVQQPEEPATRKIHRGQRAGILRFLRGENGIVMLPGTKSEVEKIQTILTKANHKPETKLSTAAQEVALKSIEGTRLLHIATHGFFLDDPDFSMMANANRYIENPLLRAGLILAGAEDFLRTGQLAAEGEQDGILTAREVMDLSLDDAELVVLSACETGLGTVQNGEGVYGLRRAFSLAGAQCVVMSMWSVDDDATQELMTRFYSNWLGGKSKQEAFRQAQFELKEKYPNPFYWSAFLMIGE